jgi:hypothetical protein
MFLINEFAEVFEKQFFIKLVRVDDIFQRAKASEAAAYAGSVPVKKKPDRIGCGLQNAFHAGFRNFKIIVHHAYRISLSPIPVFALAQIAKHLTLSGFSPR